VKAQHELVVVDGVRSFSDQAVTAMDAADVIVLVITQDIPALRSARRVLSLFKRLGYQGSKVRLVVNRLQRKSFLTIEEIEDRLDHGVFMSVPNDFKFVSGLIESGILAREMNLKHPVTRAFDTLACRLLGFEELSGRGGLFRGLFSGKKR
jgi:pilus assembly protein CpaE